MHSGASRVWPVKRQRGYVWDSVNFLWEKDQKHGIVSVEQWKQLGVVLLEESNKKKKLLFTLGSVYSTCASGAEHQTSQRNNLN